GHVGRAGDLLPLELRLHRVVTVDREHDRAHSERNQDGAGDDATDAKEARSRHRATVRTRRGKRITRRGGLAAQRLRKMRRPLSSPTSSASAVTGASKPCSHGSLASGESTRTWRGGAPAPPGCSPPP